MGKVLSLVPFLQFLSLCLVLSAHSCGGEVPPCATNWFGSPCRYKCHCVNNKCNDNGECNESSECERGWFGPSCQYVDLASTSTLPPTPAWLSDFPDTLCNPGMEMVTIYLNDVYYFTWLRLRANASVNSQDFRLQLRTGNNISAECNNMYTTTVSDTVLDIHCQPGAFVHELIITGTGVKSLCSVYISGGRNVALGQNTIQSSVLLNHVSWHAVDGNSDPHLEHGSCSHTFVNDQTPTWTLTFDRPHQVVRYVLYNRDILQERLRGFMLEADQENKNVAFTYTDLNKTSQAIYRIQSNAPMIPVSTVRIVVTRNQTDEAFVVLCEVEIFGDAVCPAGQYGRECENRCNCAKDGENCFVSTGGCPSGCAAGYHGEGCQNPCNKTYYGLNCSQKCSTNCTDLLCQPNNGTCITCISGKEGQLCDKETDGESLTHMPKVPGTELKGREPGESDSHVAAIVGSVVGFVALVTLAVTGVLIWRKCRHNRAKRGQQNPHSFQDCADSAQTVESNAKTDKPHNLYSRQADSTDDTYCNPIDLPGMRKKVQQLRTEDRSTYNSYTDSITDDPYEIIRDSTLDPYERISD